MTVTALAMGAPLELKLTVGVEMVSLAVKERVTTLPTFAKVLVELFEDKATEESVGAVLSKVTEPVPLVTGVPLLPVVSAKVMV